MAERQDHRSAVVRMLNHAGVDKDTIETVVFHVEQAILQGQADGREQCVQLIIDKYLPGKEGDDAADLA